jgi:hypothetical protein
MRCAELVRTAALLLLGATAGQASAHKASDAYLQLSGTATGMTLRVDVALRDLDAALDLDANADGRLNWGEIRTAWPAIESYVHSRVQVAGCELQPANRALESRIDGVYAALTFVAPCALNAEPAISYTLLSDVDPTHRGIARIDLAGMTGVVRVLDPAHPASVVAPAAVAGQAPAAVTPEAQALRQGFLREGIHHIVTGYDHVLFLMCLLLPSVMRRTSGGWRPVERLSQAAWPVVGIVTAFTAAHSITLALAAMKWVSMPPWFIEPAIAVTIMLAALDNLRPIFGGRRAHVTFLFGLIHGFGFAGVLAELKLSTTQFAWALLQFNVGLEIGQLMIVVVATAALFGLRQGKRYPAWVIGGGSVAAMLVGLLWFIERTADVSLMPL